MSVRSDRPLLGKRILITRAHDQAGPLAALLAARGAIPIELPTIRTEPPTDWGPVDRAIDALAAYTWAIFTSVNGVRYFSDRLRQRGQAPDRLSTVRLAAIGPATAAALTDLGLRVEFSPARYVAEAVVEGMQRFDLRGRRVLLPRAQDVREVLADGLRGQGALVDDIAVYRTTAAGDPEAARSLFAAGGVDIVTFTSSSTARNLVGLLGNRASALLKTVTIASIGPITSQTIRELGLSVQIEASEHSVPGLVAALTAAFRMPEHRPPCDGEPQNG